MDVDDPYHYGSYSPRAMDLDRCPSLPPVSISTINVCSDWWNRKIEENNQSLCKPKDIIKSIQGGGAKMGDQMAGGNSSCEREVNYEQIDFPPESEKCSGRSQIGVDLLEESFTQMEITPVGDMFVSSSYEQCIEAGDPLELPVHPSNFNFPAACLKPDAVNITLPRTPKGELLIDHNISATEALNTEQVPESSQTNPSYSAPTPKLAKATVALMMPLVSEMQDTRTVTVEATYREDMIRFQFSLTSGIIELREELAESLNLKVGTFKIRYLDDEEDWIFMPYDLDLQECFIVSLDPNIIKLSIHDI